MIRVTVKPVNPQFFKRFQARFPEPVNQSLDETAGFAKGLFMSSSAKGATGALQASWITAVTGVFKRIVINVQAYAKYLETGTGLFGPRHQRIVSKSGGPLHWTSLTHTFSRGANKGKTVYRSKMGSKKGGFKETGIFAMSTKGMPAQPMVEPNKIEVRRDLILRMKRTINQLWKDASEARE